MSVYQFYHWPLLLNHPVQWPPFGNLVYNLIQLTKAFFRTKSVLQDKQIRLPYQLHVNELRLHPYFVLCSKDPVSKEFNCHLNTRYLHDSSSGFFLSSLKNFRSKSRTILFFILILNTEKKMRDPLYFYPLRG